MNLDAPLKATLPPPSWRDLKSVWYAFRILMSLARKHPSASIILFSCFLSGFTVKRTCEDGRVRTKIVAKR